MVRGEQAHSGKEEGGHRGYTQASIVLELDQLTSLADDFESGKEKSKSATGNHTVDETKVKQAGAEDGAEDRNAAAKKDNSDKASPLKNNKETGSGNSDFGSNFKKNLCGVFE